MCTSDTPTTSFRGLPAGGATIGRRVSRWGLTLCRCRARAATSSPTRPSSKQVGAAVSVFCNGWEGVGGGREWWVLACCSLADTCYVCHPLFLFFWCQNNPTSRCGAVSVLASTNIFDEAEVGAQPACLVGCGGRGGRGFGGNTNLCRGWWQRGARSHARSLSIAHRRLTWSACSSRGCAPRRCFSRATLSTCWRRWCRRVRSRSSPRVIPRFDGERQG